MNTAYKNISDTNTAFGNLFGSCMENGVITNYDKLYNQSLNLYDELDELRDDGFKLLKEGPEKQKEGRIGMVDAIGDLIVFLYGVPHFLGYKYLEKESSPELKDVLIGYDKDVFYENVYDDIKAIINELIKTINDKRNYKAIMQAVQELDIYLATLCSLYSVDRTVLIHKITESNMSKLCSNETEVNQTLKFYRDKGVVVHDGPSPLKQADGSPYQVVYSSIDQNVGGKDYRANKFLKCVNWVEPDLSTI
jgi:hypothetical protein